MHRCKSYYFSNAIVKKRFNNAVQGTALITIASGFYMLQLAGIACALFDMCGYARRISTVTSDCFISGRGAPATTQYRLANSLLGH